MGLPMGKTLLANASQIEPAKLLAIFVCDHATPLTIPVHQEGGTGRK